LFWNLLWLDGGFGFFLYFSFFGGGWFWFLVFVCLVVVGCWGFVGVLLGVVLFSVVDVGFSVWHGLDLHG